MLYSSIRLRYQTIELGDLDIHVRGLRDTQESRECTASEEADGLSSSNWGLFGVVWPSGLSLATLMATFEIRGRRVLEVGCGLGLASLVLNRRGVDISATDVHPESGGFLAHNADLNGGPSIPFARCNWSSGDSGLGRFDLIVGSDLLYERDRAEMLAKFIDRHAHSTCEVVVIDPGRGQMGRFSRVMTSLGYTIDKLPRLASLPAPPLRQQTYRYVRGTHSLD